MFYEGSIYYLYSFTLNGLSFPRSSSDLPRCPRTELHSIELLRLIILSFCRLYGGQTSSGVKYGDTWILNYSTLCPFLLVMLTKNDVQLNLFAKRT